MDDTYAYMRLKTSVKQQVKLEILYFESVLSGIFNTSSYLLEYNINLSLICPNVLNE